MTEHKKRLDPREREILSLVAAGKSDAEIGIILNLSPKTVNYHVEKAKKKFDATRRIQLIAAVIRSGEID